MASSAEQQITSNYSLLLEGFPRHFPGFICAAPVPPMGYLYPPSDSAYAHMLGVNNCQWVQCFPQLAHEDGSSQQPLDISTSEAEDAEQKSAKRQRRQKSNACDGSDKCTGRKRGRKLLRPQDPVRRKTEQKDKYWFRNFRSYMRDRYHELKLAMPYDTQIFWQQYLSLAGRPSKGSQFPSYSKEYKNYLFAHKTFDAYFRCWFTEHGDEVLCLKYPRESDLWFVFYDYAASELVNYRAMHSL